ncbi:MAG: hypothetical protein U9O87_06855 [Verrucomicrobiota bacterium]|nr:hypothetical protein [Verrucomicrobiota bacterium]
MPRENLVQVTTKARIVPNDREIKDSLVLPLITRQLKATTTITESNCLSGPINNQKRIITNNLYTDCFLVDI